jgi:hypothetical protein
MSMVKMKDFSKVKKLTEKHLGTPMVMWKEMKTVISTGVT